MTENNITVDVKEIFSTESWEERLPQMRRESEIPDDGIEWDEDFTWRPWAFTDGVMHSLWKPRMSEPDYKVLAEYLIGYYEDNSDIVESDGDEHASKLAFEAVTILLAAVIQQAKGSGVADNLNELAALMGSIVIAGYTLDNETEEVVIWVITRGDNEDGQVLLVGIKASDIITNQEEGS